MIKYVAPFAGAWIEIFSSCSKMHGTESLPSRERGLKYGAIGLFDTYIDRRSLRGSVD